MTIEHRSPCRTCGHTARHVLMAEWMCDECRGPCRAPVETRFAAWYELRRRHQTATREGLCTCCASITRAGDRGPRPVQAVARWVTKAGANELLCASCLGYWQANAVEDEELEPTELVMLPTT